MELTRLAPRSPLDPEAPGGGEELFATVFNSAPNGITVVDAAGRYVNANASFVRLVGYGEEELRGKTLFDLTHAEDVAAGWRAFEAVVTGEADRLELDQRYLRKDGAVLWVHLSVARIADAEGRVTHVVVQVEDLSARRAAEQRLRESERRYRMLLEGVTDYAIYMLSPQGEVSSWNPGAERIKGYRADEVLGKPFAMFFTAEDRAAGLPARALETARATGRFHNEGWRLRKDGSRFWALAALEAVYDERGQIAGFAKVTRDITERREAAQRLADSEARLHAFTENSPALMCLKDRDGRYRFANARFLERHALRLEQLVGRTDGQLFPRAQALALAAHDGEVIARGKPVEFEQTVQVDGATRVQLVLKFPAAGGVGMVVTDITDRRLTEQALREQRLMLAEAQKVAGLGSWEWDPDSGRLLWSAELYRIHGLTPDAFQPTFESYLERVHPEDRQQSGAMMARALMDGRGFTMHERIVRPGGEVRYLRSHAEVVHGERGRPVKILGACLDVTDQRHSETALRQAAQDLHALTRKLVAAEEAERRRIAGELHDRVGQSLSALNINLDIVLRDAGLAPPVRRRLEDSVALVDTTLQSIESVMAELRPALLDEYGLAAALGWHAEEVARRSGLRVAVEEAPGAPQDLPLEASLALFRIAQEALNNAVKHAQAGSVTIRLGREDGSALLEVRDDGRGFDPSSARKGRWGMTTMRERAEAAGGRLEVDAGQGRGTCVRARVPTQ